MSKLYQYVAVSLLATVVGFFVGLFFIPESVIAVANLVFYGFLLILLIFAWVMKLIKRDAYGPIRFSIWLVYLFAFIDGALLYPALVYYLASLGVVLFAEIVIGTPSSINLSSPPKTSSKTSFSAMRVMCFSCSSKKRKEA